MSVTSNHVLKEVIKWIIAVLANGVETLDESRRADAWVSHPTRDHTHFLSFAQRMSTARAIATCSDGYLGLSKWFFLVHPTEACAEHSGRFFEAWLSYPMIVQKCVPDEQTLARDRQHHWRTVDRDIPCQASTSAELGSNGVDLSRFTRVSRASVFASVRLVRAEWQLQATCKTPSPDRSPLRACPGGISESSRVTAGTSPRRSTVSTSHFFGSCQLVPPPRQARRKDVSHAAIA
ncbi:hypothetical protein CA85_39200 [Allorhodopirellula solitaria]|uniref:Uncharacterized protein n=1 Tax=Allorhodopirellula solitaria TaxID=2527987 RepID=A0A5C5X8M9_9BACT|nr:hypothetical protein CA85_39200 [Allorhodopirellula solitaria]